MLGVIHKGLTAFDLTYPSGRTRTVLWACTVVTQRGDSDELIAAKKQNAQVSTEETLALAQAQPGWFKYAPRRVRRVASIVQREFQSVGPTDVLVCFHHARRDRARFRWRLRHETPS